MVKRKLAALEKTDADLANLQYKIRRDPASYAAEFQTQLLQYESLRDIFLAAPSSTPDGGLTSLRELIEFVAHVAHCYPSSTKSFPGQLISILNTHHLDLDPELREKIVGSLVLLRNKDVIDSSVLLGCLFPILTTTPSKTLRALLHQKIISDLRSSNAKATNHKLNRSVQTQLHNLVLADRSSPTALWSVKITRELWKRQLWTEAKAVEIMREAALSENEKVVVGGVRFFLGGDQEREDAEDESSDEDTMDLGKLKHQMGINKKTKKSLKALDKATTTKKKREKRKGQVQSLNFSALHLLHDPQTFAESLFSKHLQNTRSKLNLAQKLLVLQLVSRLIGLHKLTIITFYSYFLKYLTPKQPSVTSFLASLAQSCHNLVPPDVLEPLIQKIANEFVSEAAAGEVAAAGLNAIREICVRQPLAMNETLLQDLVQYRKSKDKGVTMAARGLLGLYRDVAADMLKKRDRGKDAAIGLRSGEHKQQRFGEEAVGGIEGLELLEKWKEEEKRRKRLEKGLASDESDADEEDDEDDWDAWNVQEADSDDSGGWIDVDSDRDINISDSEDDKPAQKKVRFADEIPGTENKENEDASTLVTTKTTSKLATTRILTPADLAKLAELRASASLSSSSTPSGQHQKHHAQPTSTPITNSHRHMDDGLTAESIEGLAALSKGKLTRAEKIALVQKSRDEDPDAHKGKEARKQERKREEGKSTTNKEKARKKNFLMTLGKARKNGKMGLVERKKLLMRKSGGGRKDRGGGKQNKGKK